MRRQETVTTVSGPRDAAVCCGRWLAIWLLLVMLLSYGGKAQDATPTSEDDSSTAFVQMSLSNHPGRVYSGAGPGLVVMQIFGVNIATGEEVIRFSLEQSSDAIFFSIDSTGYIKTRRTINFDLGKKFGLMVVGKSGDQAGYKYVEIVVSEENQFAPEFDQSHYQFQIYGRALKDMIGHVRFFDLDQETYNKDIILRLMLAAVPSASASTDPFPVNPLDYVGLSPKGVLTLEREVPEIYTTLNFEIEAVNTGSPRQTATATVTVDILTVKQPDTFCFSTTHNTTTLCWKNPMPGRPFPGYHLLFRGATHQEWNVVLPWVEGHQETCYTVQGTALDSNYTFTVRLSGTGHLATGLVEELFFNKTAIGYAQECRDGGFSVCNYQDPCQGHGTCVPNPMGISDQYICHCDQGWRGENCTFWDECDFDPCLQGGKCVYDGHMKFHCECREGQIGERCEHYNHCLAPPNPCQHEAQCNMHNNGSFSCNCRVGYSGDYCEIPDPCAGSSCLPDRGECRRLSDIQYECVCQAGYYGRFCESTDACILEGQPCKNQGTCLPEGTSYKCLCTSDFTGERCEYRDMCALKPCVQGECSTNPINKSYKCTCFHGYEGSECQTRVDPCRNFICNHGDCEADTNLKPRCRCQEGYLAPDCLQFDPCSGQPCKSESTCTRIDDGNYTCSCLSGWVGKNCQAYNQCVVKPPVCSSLDTCVLHPETEWPSKDAVKYSCLEVTSAPIPDPAAELSNLTSDPSQVTSAIFENVTRKLMEILDTALEDIRVAESSIEVINNLANVNLSVSEEMAHLSHQLRGFLDNYTLDAKLEPGGQVNITNHGIELKSLVLHGNESLTFSPGAVGREDETSIQIHLPHTLLDQGSSGDPVRVRYVAYDRSQLFVPDGGFWEDYIHDDLLGRQKVISASVGSEPIANLSSPVVIHLVKIRKDINHTCAYWDEAANSWSDEGVRMVEENETVVICHSDHLTNFAVLMAPTTEAMPIAHAQALAAITWAGCAISMACLFLTILTYGLFKCLHGEKTGKTLLNLCSALLFLNLMFLVGTLDVDGFSRATCVAVAVCVHYALLTSLMWMLVEAVDMYRALVTVFNKYENYYLVKRCLAAWGIPLIVVAITAAVDTNNYFSGNRNLKVCLMTAANTPVYYITILAPGCLIVATNTVVFIMVARVILKPKFQHQKSNKEASSTVTIAQVRGAFMVMILLGVTWLAGPLAIDDARLVFSYIFCICNSLQGCLIFFFRCLLNPEAQLAWKQLFTTGTLKRRRGPIRSAYTDSSSKTFGGSNPKLGVAVTGDGKGGKIPGGGDLDLDGEDGIGENTKFKDNARHSVTTLCTIANTGSLSEKNRNCSLPRKNSKGYHAHPHQLHSTGVWPPSFSGLPREAPAASSVITSPTRSDAQLLPSDSADSGSPPGVTSPKFVNIQDIQESMTQF